MLTDCRRLLEQGVATLQLHLNHQQINQLMSYLELLIKWNAVYNLTSVRDPLEMVKQHLLDSLSAAYAFREAKSILDVGSGGGLPGVVLAIVYPDKQISLIDTVHKKTAFLKQVKAELSLKNVTVYTGRVEQLEQQLGLPIAFDVITSRAFSELVNFVSWAGYLLAPLGSMIALKGQLPQSEIDQLPRGWKVTEIQAITVPELAAQRHLIWIKRID
jgi:16S rRNA (guanine527-N7)-methyltransferase